MGIRRFRHVGRSRQGDSKAGAGERSRRRWSGWTLPGCAREGAEVERTDERRGRADARRDRPGDGRERIVEDGLEFSSRLKTVRSGRREGGCPAQTDADYLIAMIT